MLSHLWRNKTIHHGPYFGKHFRRRQFINSVPELVKKPKASEVLTCHLESNNYPPWTSYFVKQANVRNDQWGRSHFNWTVGNGTKNYHILRTGCYPFIKYHCTQRPYQDLTLDDAFFRIIKVVNFGIPCLAYGLSFQFYKNKYVETVQTSCGPIKIYFHYKEDKGSFY